MSFHNAKLPVGFPGCGNYAYAFLTAKVQNSSTIENAFAVAVNILRALEEA